MTSMIATRRWLSAVVRILWTLCAETNTEVA
jgi:hypothetical protein